LNNKKLHKEKGCTSKKTAAAIDSGKHKREEKTTNPTNKKARSTWDNEKDK